MAAPQGSLEHEKHLGVVNDQEGGLQTGPGGVSMALGVHVCTGLLEERLLPQGEPGTLGAGGGVVVVAVPGGWGQGDGVRPQGRGRALTGCSSGQHLSHSMQTASSREFTVSTLVPSVTAVPALRSYDVSCCCDQQKEADKTSMAEMGGGAIPSEATVRCCAGPCRWTHVISNNAY